MPQLYFLEKVILRFDDVNWLPRSLEFFLRGYIKARVYAVHGGRYHQKYANKSLKTVGILFNISFERGN